MSDWTPEMRAEADRQYAEALKRACYICGARAGEPCQTERGNPMQTAHFLRGQ